MTATLDSLYADHALMAQVLDVLEIEIDKPDADGGADFFVVARVLDYFMSFPDLCHHPKEDLVYRKVEARDPKAAARIGNLVAEHDKLAGVVHKLAFTASRKALSEETPDAAWFNSMARTLVDSHRKHMLMEDKYFFPVADEVLTDEDWADIESQFARYNECFLCPEIEGRLDTQLQDIFDKT